MSPTWLYWPAAAGGGTAWAPSDLTSLVAWFKADAITGLSDADPVSTWSDSSGNSQDVTATSTERPIYKTSIQNSLPVVRFDGSNDRLKKSPSPITGTTARTIAVVAKADVVDSAGIIGTGVEATPILTGSGFDITPEVAIRVLGSRTFTVGFGTTSFRVLVVSCPASPTVTDVDGWLDGEALTQNTTSGTTLNTSGDLFIGERGQASIPSNFDGDVAEVVMCNAELSQSDREKLEGYLAHKWGLQGNLPPSHPYKNAAPTRTLWAPSDLTSLHSWYKADAITGLSDGDPVSTWADSSGNGYDLTQTSTARPLYQTNELNGLPVIEFDGSNDRLDASTASDWKFLHDSTGSSVFVVVKVGTSSNPNQVYGILGTNESSTANIGASLFYDDRASISRNDRIISNVSRGVSGQATSVNVTGDGAMSANAAHVISVVNDLANATAADRSKIRIDGGTAIANNTATNAASTSDPTYALQVGAIGNNIFPLLGYIAEVVICDAILSDPDRQRVEGYLAHKWGLQGNLPVDHPYKNSPPEAP